MANSLESADSHELAAIDSEQLVTMIVDGQLFGISILRVQDIVVPTQITPVPLAHAAIEGVLNLRGRIVTVINLRQCLGAPDSDEVENQKSVTVEYKGDLYTLLVDSIGDVRSVPRNRFDKPPLTLDENLRRLCSGIYQLDDALLLVLDVDRILDEETIMKSPKRTRRRKPVIVAANVPEKKLTAPKSEKPKDARKAEKPAEKKPAKVEKPARKIVKPEPKTVQKPTPVVATVDDGSLFGRLGGTPVVQRLATDIAAKILDDDALNHFLGDIDAVDLPTATEFYIAESFGGPRAFGETDIEAVRARLVDREGMDDTHLIRVAAYFAEAMKTANIAEDEFNDVLNRLEEIRNEIMRH